MRRKHGRGKPRRLALLAFSALIVGSFPADDAVAQSTGTSSTGQARPATQKPTGPAVRRPAAPTTRQAAAPKPAKPTATYWVYVGAESADLIHRIKFGPEGASVERTIAAGELAAETEGPHGLQISSDGKFLHMTTGHGTPDGKYWKYELGPDTLVGDPIFLGNFPASIDVTPDGLYAFAVNFNLHGENGAVERVGRVHTDEHGSRATDDMYHAARESDQCQWNEAVLDVHDG